MHPIKKTPRSGWPTGDLSSLAWLSALAFAGLVAGCFDSNNPTPSGDDGPSNQGDGGSLDDGSPAIADAGRDADATVDGSVTIVGSDGGADATADGSMATVDGGASVDAATSLGPSCISRLYGTYIVRPDGILIWENDPSSPEPIIDASTGDPLTGIVNVQEGQYHGCAALTDGSAKCWQTDPVNGSVAGQLGNGTTTATSALYRATPVLTAAATPLTNIVAIAPGDDESDNGCAVTGDGKLWCWGDLTWLANSGTTLHTGYAQVITTDGTTPLTGVASAVIGSGQACVLRTGSSSGVWCWGRNGEGELGQGDTTSRAYPTEVLGLAAPSKLAISYGTVVNAGDVICALDGANVKCWGDNPFGGVGSNTTTNPVLSPTYVVTQSGSLLGNVTDIQGGNDCEFAVLRSDGSLWTWGYDFQIYAASYEVADAGVTGVLAIGWAGPPAFGGPRYVTGDGVYHSGTSAVSVDCNAM